MYLPKIPHPQVKTKFEQFSFSGINKSEVAPSGSIYDLKNITTDNYGVLSSSPYKKVKQTQYDNVWYYGQEEKEIVIAGKTLGEDYPLWVSGTNYDQGEVVAYDGILYKAKKKINKTKVSNGGYINEYSPRKAIECLWEKYKENVFGYDDWSANKKVSINDVVLYNGHFYTNLTGENTDITPDVDSVNYERYCYSNFYYDGKLVEGFELSASPKEVAYLNGIIVILPDLAYYKVDSGEFGFLTSTKKGEYVVNWLDEDEREFIIYNDGYKKFDYPFCAFLISSDGNISGYDGINDTILVGRTKDTVSSAYGSDYPLTDYFNDGDIVELTRRNSVYDYTNLVWGAYKIKKVFKDMLVFESNTFSGSDFSETQNIDYNGNCYPLPGITIKKIVPKMKYIINSNNRLWGCENDTIYASELGNALMWSNYTGIDTDATFIETGSIGEFTGAVEYLNMPIFFKENEMYGVYGTGYTSYTAQKIASYGVKKGCSKSIWVVNSMLFFVNENGVCVYTGGIPAVISDMLKVRFQNALGASDGFKYYVKTKGEERAYVFDTRHNIWSSETMNDYTGYIHNEDGFFTMDEKGLKTTLRETNFTDGEIYTKGHESVIEFNDIDDGTMNKKSFGRLILKTSIDSEYGDVDVYISYDGNGQWEKITSIYSQNSGKTIQSVSIIPRRCSFYRIKMVSKGQFTLYGIQREIS